MISCVLAFVDAGKKLCGNKGVGVFTAKIVNDQQIAVINIFCLLSGIHITLVKFCLRKSVKKLRRGKIDDRIFPLHNFAGNAGGQIGLSHADTAVEEEILKFLSESVDKTMADPERVFHHGAALRPVVYHKVKRDKNQV